MNNEQLMYWIEGYLSDKFSIEACAIKSKINEMRSKGTAAKDLTDTAAKDLDAFLRKPVPNIPRAPEGTL